MAKTERDKDFSDFQSPHEASVDRLISAVDRAYHRPWLMMWRSFLHGMMTAIGAFFGTALIGILSVTIFQALGGAGLIDSMLDRLEEGAIRTQSEAIENFIDGNR
jgi:hypothetical protein